MCIAWRETYKDVVTSVGIIRWQRAYGPMAAIIATLGQYGWQLSSIERWSAANEDNAFLIDQTYQVEPLLQHIEVTIMDAVWDKASKHYLGQGLHAGPAGIFFKLLRALRWQGTHEQVGILECLL